MKKIHLIIPLCLLTAVCALDRAYADDPIPADEGDPPEEVSPPAVEIKLRPVINVASRGVTPVVVFSTAEFDATATELETVVLKDSAEDENPAKPFRAVVADLNDDGLDDLVLLFRTEKLNIDLAGPNQRFVEATLILESVVTADDGTSVVQWAGEDTVRLILPKVRKPNKGRH